MKLNIMLVEENLEAVPTIKALEGEINQVLLNILVNAAHAIKSKGIQGTIKIHTYCDDGFVKCEISDNGIGISEEILTIYSILFLQLNQ
jgi:Signal transduction histidine kinase